MTESDLGNREAVRERQSYVRHELRGSLAVMYPALSMLLDGSAGELTPKQREYLEILERGAERLERLIAGAIQPPAVDGAGAAVEPAAVPLGEVLDEVLAVRRLSGQQGPLIRVEHAPGPRAVAWADRQQVLQIVENLLGNAAQYSSGGAAIRVGVSASGDSPTVSFAVQDEGLGIPAEELPHVFDFGFRGVAAREAALPGLGIGLWVCRELVGRSVTVTVALPAAGAGGAR